MKKSTKHFFEFILVVLFGLAEIGGIILCVNILDCVGPILFTDPMLGRYVNAAIILIVMIVFVIIIPLIILTALHFNIISFVELKCYLQNLNKPEAIKFLARMIWFSDINVRKYRENEYLIHRMFYPQAELVQKTWFIWVIKINHKNIKLFVNNVYGKLFYYKEKILFMFIIKPMYPSDYQTILQMVNFLKQNFQSDLTDAQINLKLDDLFIQ